MKSLVDQCERAHLRTVEACQCMMDKISVHACSRPNSVSSSNAASIFGEVQCECSVLEALVGQRSMPHRACDQEAAKCLWIIRCTPRLRKCRVE